MKRRKNADRNGKRKCGAEGQAEHQRRRRQCCRGTDQRAREPNAPLLMGAAGSVGEGLRPTRSETPERTVIPRQGVKPDEGGARQSRKMDMYVPLRGSLTRAPTVRKRGATAMTVRRREKKRGGNLWQKEEERRGP